MKNFITRLFGIDDRKSGHSSLPPSQGAALTIQDGSENATRRQLVQVMMRDVMRRSGIPPSWIECQVMIVASTSRGPGMYVRLVVKHWDDRLLNYAFAFQKALLTDIARFEPKASSWLYGISWQLEVANSCPHTTLPDKDFWTDAPAAGVSIPTSAPNSALTSVPFNASPVGPITGALPPSPQAEAKAAKSARDLEATEDLERLFAIRDHELGRQAADRLSPAGYEKTQPSPL